MEITFKMQAMGGKLFDHCNYEIILGDFKEIIPWWKAIPIMYFMIDKKISSEIRKAVKKNA